MARPAKAINATSKHNTKEEIEIRQKAEKKLKGGNDKLVPPSYLTTGQKKVFKFIVDNFKSADILGNLDYYILCIASVTIDNITELDKAINEVDDIGMKSKLMSARTRQMPDFFRCCNELSLSPQARAKLSLAEVKSTKSDKNPLLEALNL